MAVVTPGGYFEEVNPAWTATLGWSEAELKSRPFDPHPLFASFIEAAVKQSRLV